MPTFGQYLNQKTALQDEILQKRELGDAPGADQLEAQLNDMISQNRGVEAKIREFAMDPDLQADGTAARFQRASKDYLTARVNDGLKKGTITPGITQHAKYTAPKDQLDASLDKMRNTNEGLYRSFHVENVDAVNRERVDGTWADAYGSGPLAQVAFDVGMAAQVRYRGAPGTNAALFADALSQHVRGLDRSAEYIARGDEERMIKNPWKGSTVIPGLMDAVQEGESEAQPMTIRRLTGYLTDTSRPVPDEVVRQLDGWYKTEVKREGAAKVDANPLVVALKARQVPLGNYDPKRRTAEGKLVDGAKPEEVDRLVLGVLKQAEQNVMPLTSVGTKNALGSAAPYQAVTKTDSELADSWIQQGATFKTDALAAKQKGDALRLAAYAKLTTEAVTRAERYMRSAGIPQESIDKELGFLRVPLTATSTSGTVPQNANAAVYADIAAASAPTPVATAPAVKQWKPK